MSIAKWLLAKKLGGGSPFPPVIKRVTGNPIEFTDGADAPLVKCVTQITGSQDLHGQDKPWVGGSGKNKLPLVLADIKARNTSGTWSGNNYTRNGVTFSVITDESESITGIKATGTATANTAIDLSVADVADNTQVILNGCPSDGSAASYYIGISTLGYKCVGSDVYYNNYNNFLIYCFVASGYAIPSGGVLFTPMVRLATVTDSTFTPYSNICPITAYTEGEVEVRGKNLLDPNSSVAYGSGSSSCSVSGDNINVQVSGQYTGIVFDKVLPNGTYSISFSFKFNSSGKASVTIVDSDNTTSLWTTGEFTSDTTRSGAFTVTNGIAHIRFYCTRDNYTGNVTISNLMLNNGSLVEDYEPYTSTTHTTTYPSAIYRGSEDVVNGEVVADRMSESFNIGANDGTVIGNYRRVSYTPSYAVNLEYRESAICDKLPYVGDYTLDDAHFYINYAGTSIFFFLPNDSQAYTVTVAYPLATPTTSSVTPTNLPIKSLSGYNHIESSTGEMVVDYITDAYQNFVNTVESALPNTTRNLLSASKGGTKAMDIFLSLEKRDDKEEEVKEETKDDMR